jgi:hypothetical protein
MSRIPNVPERVKEAPAHALRAVFAGIGQALLLSDRMRRKLKNPRDDNSENGHGVVRIPVRTAPTAEPAASNQTSAVTDAVTDAGAVAEPAAPAAAAPAAAPVATAAAAAAAPSAAAPAAPVTPAAPAAPPPAAAPAASPAASAPPVAKQTPAKARATKASAGKDVTAQAAAMAAPIPNYDELSVASLRARLRGLDRAQVRQLLSYEKAHGDRAEVIAMYERRIEKLGQADG